MNSNKTQLYNNGRNVCIKIVEKRLNSKIQDVKKYICFGVDINFSSRINMIEFFLIFIIILLLFILKKQK